MNQIYNINILYRLWINVATIIGLCIIIGSNYLMLIGNSGSYENKIILVIVSVIMTPIIILFNLLQVTKLILKDKKTIIICSKIKKYYKNINDIISVKEYFWFKPWIIQITFPQNEIYTIFYLKDKVKFIKELKEIKNEI